MFRNIVRNTNTRRFINTGIPITPITPEQEFYNNRLRDLSQVIKEQHEHIDHIYSRIGISFLATFATIVVLGNETNKKINIIRNDYNMKLHGKVSNEEFGTLKKSHEQLVYLFRK